MYRCLINIYKLNWTQKAKDIGQQVTRKTCWTSCYTFFITYWPNLLFEWQCWSLGQDGVLGQTESPGDVPKLWLDRSCFHPWLILMDASCFLSQGSFIFFLPIIFTFPFPPKNMGHLMFISQKWLNWALQRLAVGVTTPMHKICTDTWMAGYWVALISPLGRTAYIVNFHQGGKKALMLILLSCVLIFKICCLSNFSLLK